MNIKKHIPNAITCLNVLSGFVAIIFALRGETYVGSLQGWQWCCVFIAIAAVADFCDGFAARLLHAYSDMGKELDSLCDAVSFGVAPGVLLFQSLADVGAPGWQCWFAAAVPVAAVLRLARFNIDTRQTVSFIGMPVPANAIFWIGFVAFVRGGATWAVLPEVFIPLVLVESWLMLSGFKIFSLKFRSYGWKGNARRWLLIASAPVFLLIFGLSGLMWLIVFYLFLSLFRTSEE